AIVQVARGHRKTDLFSTSEYPSAFRLKNGNSICLPYLSALIRLADEIDVAADRNPLLLYDIKTITDEVQIMYNKAQKAVKRLDISEDAFTLYVDGSDPSLSDYLWNLKGKMQATLDYCRQVIQTRTPYSLTQQRVELILEETP
ncbi:MAG: hypothetical protein IIZ39_12565, partial [Blautia sp.]|nr:hypothetical protein [Blautia sp.]